MSPMARPCCRRSANAIEDDNPHPAPPALRAAAFVLAAGTSLWAAADYLAQAVRLARWS